MLSVVKPLMLNSTNKVGATQLPLGWGGVGRQVRNNTFAPLPFKLMVSPSESILLQLSENIDEVTVTIHQDHHAVTVP